MKINLFCNTQFCSIVEKLLSFVLPRIKNSISLKRWNDYFPDLKRPKIKKIKIKRVDLFDFVRGQSLH